MNWDLTAVRKRMETNATGCLGNNFYTEFGKFQIDLSFIDWESTGAYKNSLEFAASYGRQFSENMFLSFGIFSTDRRVKEENLYLDLNNFNALFLTLGAKTTFMGFDIDLAIADSHLSSDSWRKQTVAKIAIGKSF